MVKSTRNFGRAGIKKSADRPLEEDLAEALVDPGQALVSTAPAESEPARDILRERIRGLEALLKEKERALEEYREREVRLSQQLVAVSRPMEHRAYQRYPVDWKAALVSEEVEGRQIFYGRASDVSLGGMSFLCDHNIFFREMMTALLSVPPLISGGKEKIVEVSGRMIYTVLAASIQQFRVGIQFVEFKGDGKTALEDYLATRYSYA